MDSWAFMAASLCSIKPSLMPALQRVHITPSVRARAAEVGPNTGASAQAGAVAEAAEQLAVQSADLAAARGELADLRTRAAALRKEVISSAMK